VHIRPRGEGDSRFAVFKSASGAVSATLAIQRAFAAEPWPTPRPIRVRIAVHTGEAELRDGDYYGSAVNRCARLRGIGHGGQILLSEATTVLVREGMLSGVRLIDLGRHRLKDLTEPERVSQVVASDLASEFPPLASLDARPHNLPTHPTALLGRERELAEVHKLFGDGARLVTLTGPGGTGKTRLSLQVAAEMLDDFEHGVFAVELAPISDPMLVPSTIAQALGVREVGGRPIIDAVKEYLRARSVLLLLDNFEQILPAASVVADLLAACPSLAVLTTSREPLRLRSEHEYAVPPLALPDARRVTTANAVSPSPAVALFVQRAQAVRADFALTDENASALAEVCARLDGLPLAIELAAARTKLLPPLTLLNRLERRLTVLTGGARDLPARQRTLRNTIDWSHNLLDLTERRLFRRLAVFVGGCTLEATEAVCCAGGDLDADLLDVLASLVDKSLLRQIEGRAGEPRFTMLETIREYGLEQLRASGEVETIRSRHAAHYLELVTEAGPQIVGADQVRWLDRLDLDHDNVLAALNWAINRRDAEIALRMAASLANFWYFRGRFNEAQTIRTAVLALPAEPGHDGLRVALLQGAGMLTRRMGDLDTARAFLEEALSISRRTNDPRLLIPPLAQLGVVADNQGDYVTARAVVEECLTLARAVGDTFHAGMATHILGLVALEADHDLEAAWSLNADSLALFQQIGNGRYIGIVRLAMGRVARARGDLDEARLLAAEALRLQLQVGDVGNISTRLHVLATIDADAGRLAQAVRLAAAASAMDETMGTRVPPVARHELQGWLAPARSTLGDDLFARCWAEGRAMTLEQAVAYALDENTSY
jgi:predicted ATPase